MTTAKDDADGELPTMIQPGKVTDLQAMVRDALRKNGIDPVTGDKPQVQPPRTLPMAQRPAQVPGVRVQATPKAPAPAPVSVARPVQATPPAVTAAPAVEKKRSSFVPLLTMGLFALAAAGGAVWVAKNKAQFSTANAAPQTTAAAPQPTTSESAVGFVVAPRPGENGTPATPTNESKPAETTPPAAAAAPSPPPPATFTPEPKPPEPKTAAKEAAPTPPTTHAPPPTTHTAKAAPVAAKPAEEPKPKPVAAAPPPPEPKPKPPEKTASAEKPATPPPAPPPAPGGSVDAILQQQLKSAIP